MEQALKRTDVHFAVAYMILVALPLVGLAGVLKSGRTLSAPIPVGGVWRIQLAPDEELTLPCGKILSPAKARLIISQSGRSFSLSFGKMSSESGVVEGNHIRASLVSAATWTKEGSCDEETVTNLTATLDPSTRLLVGMLAANRCPSCATVHFHAVREDQGETAGVN
jgi:hypothetical protein